MVGNIKSYRNLLKKFLGNQKNVCLQIREALNGENIEIARQLVHNYILEDAARGGIS